MVEIFYMVLAQSLPSYHPIHGRVFFYQSPCIELLIHCRDLLQSPCIELATLPSSKMKTPSTHEIPKCPGSGLLLVVAAFLAFGCGCNFGVALDWAGATAGAFGGVTGAAFGGVTGAICPVLATAASLRRARWWEARHRLHRCFLLTGWVWQHGPCDGVLRHASQQMWAPCLPPQARPVLETTAQTWASGDRSTTQIINTIIGPDNPTCYQLL